MQKDIPKAVRKGKKGKGAWRKQFRQRKGYLQAISIWKKGKDKKKRERERERNQGDAVAAESVCVPTLAI